MVAERRQTGQLSTPAPLAGSMAFPRGTSSLADEVMEAVAGDMDGEVIPVGLAGTSSQAQEANSPSGRSPTGRRTPRTPLRTRGVVLSTPRSSSNLDEMDTEFQGREEKLTQAGFTAGDAAKVLRSGMGFIQQGIHALSFSGPPLWNARPLPTESGSRCTS